MLLARGPCQFSPFGPIGLYATWHDLHRARSLREILGLFILTILALLALMLWGAVMAERGRKRNRSRDIACAGLFILSFVLLPLPWLWPAMVERTVGLKEMLGLFVLIMIVLYGMIVCGVVLGSKDGGSA